VTQGPPQPATFRFAPVVGEHIVGDRLPGSGPAYLFLHGLGSVRTGEKSASLFAHAAARGRAAIRYDSRGHGDSSGQIGQLTVSELIADAGKVLDRAGRAILVGSSLGGVVAAFLAAARPADVHGLVLIAPAFGFLPRMASALDAEGRMRTSEGVTFAVHPRVLADAESLDEPALAARLTVPTRWCRAGSASGSSPPSRTRRRTCCWCRPATTA
jgi:pimeloyl-ACP methyl ester carboxylesterase